MGRQVYIVLGNGFSIDFINFYKKIDTNAEKINLLNLFDEGARIKWPTDQSPGFISYKNTKNLWNVGARQGLSNEKSLEIIERIVTCANVYSLRKKKEISDGEGNGFLHAYIELVAYLKYLFVYYDSLIKELDDKVVEWPWLKFIKRLCEDENIDQVNIVTYNYDIWLERLLKKVDVDFEMVNLEPSKECKVKIIKPHGSISFLHKTILEYSSFQFNYRNLSIDSPVDEIELAYDDLNRHCLVNFLTPPAGEMKRSNPSWATNVFSFAENEFEKSTERDIAIFCGLSYWHVDRSEIDYLLNSLNSSIEMFHINPKPSPTFDAVLNSLFKNYVHFMSADILDEVVL